VGRLIRKLHIDELPQIFNILRGDMSWIGPRPESITLASQYRLSIAGYNYRYMVPPGITGWAAVNQGNVGGVDAALTKLEYDFYYIRNLSPWMDLLIVFQTLRIILLGGASR
jgi:lipopolysaccharide/colanic/teichoic acid biosynthesis glycosyltransferase